MLWKLIAREIGVVLIIGASKAFADYMSKQKPKQIIDVVATSVKTVKSKTEKVGAESV